MFDAGASCFFFDLFKKDFTWCSTKYCMCQILMYVQNRVAKRNRVFLVYSLPVCTLVTHWTLLESQGLRKYIVSLYPGLSAIVCLICLHWESLQEKICKTLVFFLKIGKNLVFGYLVHFLRHTFQTFASHSCSTCLM